MGEIILPGDLPAQTEKQRAAALKPEELPECVGNPKAPCTAGTMDFLIKGYDDKHRCNPCNALHIELVMEEAGKSAPNVEPKFVSPKLNRRAKNKRAARIEALNAKLAVAGVTGQATNSSPRMLQPGEAVDMRDAARQQDEFGTRDEGITEAERRRRIVVKYRKKQPL